jgi:predicted metalloprotease with PDZ domain
MTCLGWFPKTGHGPVPPFILLCALAAAQAADVRITYSVSVPDPAAHRFHVALRCEGLPAELNDFKMPAWSPGFYRLLDYAKNVTNFRAEDGLGRALPWEKVTANTWRVASGVATAIALQYDVFGNTVFAAQNFVDPQRAFITPPGMFLHPAGRLDLPATITFTFPSTWTRIATGLDPVPGKPHAFSAANFNVLYDSPILMGTQELLQFEVQGIPHRVAIENVPPAVDRTKMLADLQRIVEAATRMMGDIPYPHYTFLMMGSGNGGIEHGNSSANVFNGQTLTTEAGYLRWLSFIAHEYFHLYNVKRIRPLALGPFDYDRENLTSMLWVSEGLSVYYQDLLLVRAGLMTSTQYVDKLQSAIARFENSPGRRYQSAAESSWNTWGTSGVGGDRSTTISYYDNGAMLGAMLDLKIRHESKNRKSLDDVMRALYRTYYQQKKRGFTAAEFRAECEAAAGTSFDDVLEYASNTKEVDYAKYFALAGLAVSVESQPAPGVSLGIYTQIEGDHLTIRSSTNPELRIGDSLAITTKALSDLLASKKPGDRVTLRVSRGGAEREVELELGKNSKREFKIQVAPDPDSLSAAIRKDWFRTVAR